MLVLRILSSSESHLQSPLLSPVYFLPIDQFVCLCSDSVVASIQKLQCHLLKRMVVGGRLYNYYKQANKMTPREYAQKVITGEMHDPVLSFQLKNGFRFVKVLPDYLYDRRSVNYASFLEWVNLEYR